MQKFILFGCLVFVLGRAFAQKEGTPFTIGMEYRIASEVLGEERPYLVYLPDDYAEEEDKSYPVVYLLDGRSNFAHTTACVEFLSNNGRIPPMIVVGVPNLDDHRTRDLTPVGKTTKKDFPTSGGADQMLAFMQQELLPHIEKTYRTHPYRILIGHSFGGLFAVHTLTHHPGIFQAYLAISPSLWWDEQALVTDQTVAYLKEAKDLRGHLYMTMGSENGTMLGGAWKLAALLEEKNNPDFHWHFERLEDENHGSVPYVSTYQGLQFIFKAWQIEDQREAFLAAGIEAIDAYEEQAKKLYGFAPNWNEDRLVGLGDMLLNAGKAQKAVPILAKATTLFPESVAAQFKYGEVLARAGQEKDAIKSLRQVLAMQSDHFQALALLKQLGEDVSNLVPDVQLSKKELDQYTADYLLEMGMTLHITSDGQQLWAEAPILAKEELVAMGDHRFFVISKNSTIVFQTDDQKITGITVETPGGTFSGTRE